MNDEAFDDFFASGYTRLVGALALVTGDVDVARDAVDEALARAWERTHRGRGIDSIEAWVRVVALNVARGRFRRAAVEHRARARLLAASASVPDVAHTVDIQRALAGLPRRQREAVALRYFLDLPVAGVAKALGVSEGTVKSTLHRARTALAVALGTDEHMEIGVNDD